MQRMKNQIEQLQAELLYVKGDSSAPFEELQVRLYIFENCHLRKTSYCLKLNLHVMANHGMR
ncbi:hypothetical protein Hanom_Chr09g00869571 [Helianthus anomalus]